MINNPLGLTGGPNGINGIGGPNLLGLGINTSTQFYFYTWIIIGVIVFGLVRLQHSRIGRAWNYIREDETAAEASGVDVRSYKLLAFVLGAALAGIAGNIYASKQMSVSPQSFTFIESSLLFAIVLLGGLGSIPGTILGAGVVVIFPEIFRRVCQLSLAVLRAGTDGHDDLPSGRHLATEARRGGACGAGHPGSSQER